MKEIIKTEVEKHREEIKQNKSAMSVSDDRAFSYMLLKYFFDVNDFTDQDDCVTDGTNDGGIDFVFLMMKIPKW